MHLLYLLGPGGHAAVKNMLAQYGLPLQDCTDLITEALRGEKVGLA